MIVTFCKQPLIADRGVGSIYLFFIMVTVRMPHWPFEVVEIFLHGFMYNLKSSTSSQVASEPD